MACNFSSLIWPSLTLPTSAFPSLHIVGSLKSKLPSIIAVIVVKDIYKCIVDQNHALRAYVDSLGVQSMVAKQLSGRNHYLTLVEQRSIVAVINGSSSFKRKENSFLNSRFDEVLL